MWAEKPTITEIESLISPVEDLKFPTVTLCPENPNPDRWGSAIKLFDHMKRKCDNNG